MGEAGPSSLSLCARSSPLPSLGRRSIWENNYALQFSAPLVIAELLNNNGSVVRTDSDIERKSGGDSRLRC